MSAMWISQVTCSLYLVWLNSFDKILNDLDVLRTKGILFDHASLVERQVQRVNVGLFNSEGHCSRAGLGSTNKTLNVKDLWAIDVALGFGSEFILYEILQLLGLF